MKIGSGWTRRFYTCRWVSQNLTWGWIDAAEVRSVPQRGSAWVILAALVTHRATTLWY